MNQDLGEISFAYFHLKGRYKSQISKMVHEHEPLNIDSLKDVK